jgi:hypothetical protein
LRTANCATSSRSPLQQGYYSTHLCVAYTSRKIYIVRRHVYVRIVYSARVRYENISPRILFFKFYFALHYHALCHEPPINRIARP